MFNWKRIINDSSLSTSSKTKRIESMLKMEFGNGAAMRYSGAVIAYLTSGEDTGGMFPEELSDLWTATKTLLDSERSKKSAPRRKPKKATKTIQDAPNDSEKHPTDWIDEALEEMLDPNVLCGLADREKPGSGRVYVSDVIDMREIVGGKLNIIYSPPGSGKTTFTETVLKKYAESFSQELLYLAPTRALVESVRGRSGRREVFLKDGASIVRWKQDGITAMTYAAFGSCIAREKERGTYCDAEWWHDDALICLDELHVAVHQAYYSKGDNVTKSALLELVERCKNESNTLVTLSATPKPGISFFRFWNDASINLIKSTRNLKGYESKETVGYLDLDNLLAKLNPEQRGIIYASQIKQVKHIVEVLEGRGIQAVGIWSDKNGKHPMNEMQIKAAKSVINEEKLPDDAQVLVFNAAYETGLNIKPEKSPLDYVVVHSSNEDTIVQARGRYRGDIDILYRKEHEDKSEEFVRDIDREVIRPLLGMRLGPNDRKKLREKLNFKDGRGRLIGMEKVADQIRKNGYSVTKGKSGGMRYWVINELG